MIEEGAAPLAEAELAAVAEALRDELPTRLGQPGHHGSLPDGPDSPTR